MNGSVLVFNSDYSPLCVTNTKRAIVLMLMNKVDVVKCKENEYVASAKELFEVPAAIRLRQYVRLPNHDIPLTRQNVYIRDNHVCQYCGSNEHLTIDHIIPKKRGGEWTWENLVTCCFSCNNKKGDKAKPEEVGLSLRNKPKKPSRVILFKKYMSDDYWSDFFPQAN